MNIQEYTQSKTFRTGVIVVGVLLVALVSFASGVAVGLHKARFSYAWGEKYEQRFMGGQGPMRGMGIPDGQGFRNPHGALGEVVSVSGDTLLMKDWENQESTVRISGETVIMKQRERIEVSQLVAGEKIAVVGKPGDDGAVVADFVRVLEPRMDGDDRRFPFGPDR
ncbi:MAG: hypothetical protein KA731_01705 [Candidatus Moranbacteria bacterium]|nr:hypothetical protein [Candidatus Moranbacteria bacterium]